MLRRWLRRIAAAVIPTAIALGVHAALFGSTARWVLFYPAVFAAAWFGGFIAGVLAAILSALALVWFVIPPVHTFVLTGGELMMGSTFFAMSALMSGLLALQRHTAAELARDLAERERVEAALRSSETRLRDAERIAHLGSWTWDLVGDTVHWSDELQHMFQRAPGQPAPTPAERLFVPESGEKVRAALEQLRDTGEPVELELDAKLPDGKLLTISAHAEAVRDASGRTVRITATALDITELKNLQRLRDEWTSVIAHDLRQPIGFITMAASALGDLHEGTTSDTERQLTTRIAAAGRNLARMVDDLLAVSLLEAHRVVLERDWVNPRTVVDEAIARIEHIRNDRPIHVSQSEGLRDVCADPMRLGQVLGNLLSNAVKYGEPKTPIDIRLEQRAADVEISVTNTGPGIAPEDIPRLFGRFVRSAKTKGSAVRGLGVGLYIAKELVEAHQGHIGCDSTPGKTTTFRITLPSREASIRAA